MDSGIYNVDAFRQTDVSGINFAIRCVIGRYSKFLIRQSQAENQLWLVWPPCPKFRISKLYGISVQVIAL